MTDKGNRRQGLWQEKGITSNLRDRQRVRMADDWERETSSEAGKRRKM
jgi:hypothetical protein